MDRFRINAVVAGAFFVLAAVTAIAAVALYDPVLHDGAYVLDGARSDRGVLAGALLEAVLATSVVGTATALFPVVRRQSEALALSYVAGRVLEAAFIAVGTISLLAIVTLRGDANGADAGLLAAARSLVAVHDWTFLFGPGLAIGVNTTLLASLMYRSRLVPRAIAVTGIAGGPLVLASSVAVLLGLYRQTSAPAAAAALPVFAWEMSLAGWLIAKGFRRTPVLERAAHAPDLRAPRAPAPAVT